MSDSSFPKGSTVLHAIAITVAVALFAALQPRLGWKALTSVVAPTATSAQFVLPPQAQPARPGF